MPGTNITVKLGGALYAQPLTLTITNAANEVVMTAQSSTGHFMLVVPGTDPVTLTFTKGQVSASAAMTGRPATFLENLPTGVGF